MGVMNSSRATFDELLKPFETVFVRRLVQECGMFEFEAHWNRYPDEPDLKEFVIVFPWKTITDKLGVRWKHELMVVGEQLLRTISKTVGVRDVANRPIIERSALGKTIEMRLNYIEPPTQF